MNIPLALKSRKFWLAIIGAGVAFCNAMFNWGLTTDQVWQVVAPLLTFIGAEGVADAAERYSVAPSNIQRVEVKK